MNSVLATETAPQPATRSLLETWGKNERMRHIPPVDWMVHRVDVEIRRVAETLWASFAALAPEDASIEEAFRTFCRAVDRICEIARHGRNNVHPPAELGQRIGWGLNQAAGSLRALDANLIGRRFPFQTFERSKAEPLYAAILVTMSSLDRIARLLRDRDPDLDEHLLEGLVTLEHPLNDQVRVPIA
jgi:hypothetical protein